MAAITAVIRSRYKTPNHRRDPEIFDEKARMHGNTVNGSFALGLAELPKVRAKPSIMFLEQFD
jgi:hypothetical protein